MTWEFMECKGKCKYIQESQENSVKNSMLTWKVREKSQNIKESYRESLGKLGEELHWVHTDLES